MAEQIDVIPPTNPERGGDWSWAKQPDEPFRADPPRSCETPAADADERIADTRQFTPRTSTSSTVYTYKNIKFWAEGGRIQWVDERDGENSSLSIDELAARAAGIARMAAATRGRVDRAVHVRAVEDMVRCAYTAKAQGDPHDPAVIAYRAKQSRSYGKRFRLPKLPGGDGPIAVAGAKTEINA